MNVHRFPDRRSKPRKPAREELDDAIGFALLIVAVAGGLRFYGWLIELFLSHFPL